MTREITIPEVISELTKSNPTSFVYSNETNEISEWDIGETKTNATKPTSEEITAKLDEMKIEQQNNETAKENNKTSGKAKLKALGLTDAEILALIGDR